MQVRALGFLRFVALLFAVSLPFHISPAFAAEGSMVVAQSTITEKEAYEAAKELGTIEAWEAFLNNFPKGFRADLARAYLKRIGAETVKKTPKAPTPPVQTATPPPPPPPPVAPSPPLQPVMLGPDASPWGNANHPMDEGNTSVYSASVQSSGLELITYCGVDQTLSVLLSERNRGVYPEFGARIEQGLAATRGQLGNPDSSQLYMQFSNGALYPVTAHLQGLTGDVEIRDAQGSGFNPIGPIAGNLMAEKSVTLSAQPFGATFQLTKSRAAICNVLNSCGVSVTGCQRFTPPVVSSRQPVRSKKTVTGKSQPGKCSSRSVWLEGQCILKSQVASFCGPGYHREGSRCVSNANVVTTVPGGNQVGSGSCPAGAGRVNGQCQCHYLYKMVGNKCVMNFKCEGGRVQYTMASGLKSCRCPGGTTPQYSGDINRGYICLPPGGTTKQVNVPQVACAGGGSIVNGQCVCPANRPRYENGKCKKPSGNQIIQQLQNPNQPQNQQQTQQQPACPSGKVWRSGKCRNPKTTDILKQFVQPQNQQQNRQQQPQQQQQQQIQIPGLGGITISDARLKRDVAHLVTLEDGLKLYSFRYLWSDTAHVGVMAQDLMADQATRDAVIEHPGGYYMVDYGKLGLRMVTLEAWRASH